MQNLPAIYYYDTKYHYNSQIIISAMLECIVANYRLQEAIV